jgi:carbonic anhydrase
MNQPARPAQTLEPSSPHSYLDEPQRLRLNLGLPGLLPAWRRMFAADGLREDLIAGINVAGVALPLSLAIGLASGVEPGVALLTSIVAGVVCALLGGTTLAVSGPAAALAVLVGTILVEHGASGVVFVGLGAGLLQLLTGVLGLGRVIRYLPVAVVHGFTAGMGTIIVVGQLPRALGMPAPDQTHVFEVVSHLIDYVAHTDPKALLVSGSSIAIMLGLPRLWPRLPAVLFAVLVPSLLSHALGLSLEPLGPFPRLLPELALPSWPAQGLFALLEDVFVVYAVASLETLLAASALDKRTPDDRHDPDQELIGQGLGNVLVGLLGGIVVSAVIFRSSLNVASGARTRRASIFHALALLAVVWFGAHSVAQIPLASLAGVLIGFGVVMLRSAPLARLWRISRVDALVMAFTWLAIVVLDLADGIQSGVVAALAIAAIGLGRPSTDLHVDRDEENIHHIAIAGPLTFVAAGQLERLRRAIDRIAAGGSVVINLSGVTSIDASGAECMAGLVRSVQRHGGKIALLGLRAKPRKVLVATDVAVAACIADQVADAERLLGRTDVAHGSRLVLGVRRFHKELRARYEPLLRQLGSGQKPHTLFITCADSRINPNLLTGTDPGELFIMRNIGNMVPSPGNSAFITEAAGIEYAVGVLGVKEIVVCGHSGCGAVKALLGGAVPAGLGHVLGWKEHASPLFGGHGHEAQPDEGAKANVCAQLEHLRGYAIVQQGIADGRLKLHGWFYNVGTGLVSTWSDASQRFEALGGDPLADAAGASASEPEVVSV